MVAGKDEGRNLATPLCPCLPMMNVCWSGRRSMDDWPFVSGIPVEKVDDMFLVLGRWLFLEERI
jgi:hypothetical protein